MEELSGKMKKIQVNKRKFSPHKINFEAIDKDEWSSKRIRFAPQKCIFNKPKVETDTERIQKQKIQPIRMAIKVADFNNISPVLKEKTRKKAQNIRKELFDSKKNKTDKNLNRFSKKNSRNENNRSQLDETEPLIDISDIETILLKKSHISLNNPFYKTKSPILKDSKECIVSSQQKSKAHGTGSFSFLSSKCTRNTKHLFSPDLVNLSHSSSVNEFIEMENNCNISVSYVKSPLPLAGHKCNLPDNNIKYHEICSNINNLLDKQQDDFNNLNKRVESLMNEFKENYSKTKLQVLDLLKKLDKDNDNIESPMHKLKLSTEKKKKSVAFDLDNKECDEKYQQANQRYNSLKDQYKSILCTPKSTKKNVQEKKNISYKVHNQCLLLQDTPVGHHT